MIKTEELIKNHTPPMLDFHNIRLNKRYRLDCRYRRDLRCIRCTPKKYGYYEVLFLDFFKRVLHTYHQVSLEVDSVYDVKFEAIRYMQDDYLFIKVFNSHIHLKRNYTNIY